MANNWKLIKWFVRVSEIELEKEHSKVANLVVDQSPFPPKRGRRVTSDEKIRRFHSILLQGFFFPRMSDKWTLKSTSIRMTIFLG